jgi:ComF family protein
MRWLFDVWDDFISLLFPRICYGCGNQLMRNENLICTECHVAIPRTNHHFEPDNQVAQLFWGRCHITKAAAFSFYNKGSRIRRIIHNLKYNGISEIGPVIGNIYGHTLKSSGFMDDIDIIVPVPLHASRKRSRGYNQSDLIAQGLSEATGITVVSGELARVSKSQTQTRRSRYDRWKNVEGIFCAMNPEFFRDKHVLLVDDVITTGSTIEACANELLKIEGVRVSVTAIAYAVM